MIGDDVVDLADPEAADGARHPRFDARAFHHAERGAIARAADPLAARWACWAAKEAAYKLARRLDASQRFAPRRFRVTWEAPGAARVSGAGRRYCVSLVRDAEALHAVARLESADGGRAFQASAPRAPGEEPGGAARALALRVLTPLLGARPGELAIETRERLPELQLRGAPLAAALSLSHHGRFVSFACWLPEPGEAA